MFPANAPDVNTLGFDKTTIAGLLSGADAAAKLKHQLTILSISLLRLPITAKGIPMGANTAVVTSAATNAVVNLAYELPIYNMLLTNYLLKPLGQVDLLAVVTLVSDFG